MRGLTFLTIGVAAILMTAAAPAQQRGTGTTRFEVTSLRAVRPILVKTIADLEKKDVAAAKADMENYDSAWNGVEVYVNTRSMDLYNEIEHHYQTAVTDALNKPNPDAAAVLTDAKAMLAKYDEMLALVEKSAPLNRLYDDVARLRIERVNASLHVLAEKPKIFPLDLRISTQYFRARILWLQGLADQTHASSLVLKNPKNALRAKMVPRARGFNAQAGR